MRTIIFISLCTTLLFACANSASPTETSVPTADITASTNLVTAVSQPDELVIVGRLKQISTPPGCGSFLLGAVAEYTNLKILNGQYFNDTIYVVHGCPEIPRNHYANGSGNLALFQVGDYHILHLTSENVFTIEIIDSGDIQLPVTMKEYESTCATKGSCNAIEFVQLQDGMMYFCSQVDSYSP